MNSGKINLKNIEISQAIESPLYDNGFCKFSTNDNNFLDKKNKFIKKFKNCLLNENKKFILIIGDSHGVDLYNSLASLTNHSFVIGINQPSCRPITKKNCIFINAYNFAKTYSKNIEAILFTQKGSYMLTDTSKGKFFL